MKRVSLVVVPVLAAGLAACHRAAPDPSAAASPTPSPVVASAPPLSLPPDEPAPAQPEAAPSPEPRVAEATAPPPASRARSGASASRSTSAPQRPAEPLEPVGGRADSDPEPARSADGSSADRADRSGARERARSEAAVLAAGTVLPVRLDEGVTTKTARPEDPVVAVLDEDVELEGQVVLPAGAEVLGHVVTADRSGRVKGRARLVVAFDEIRTGRRTYTISATRFDVTAASSKDRDAKIAGGAAAAGAIIGAIKDGAGGAVKGGILGGAAGGAAVLATRGHDAELRPGRYRITLREPLAME
jgi:type IV secretory pathway VirB10-like protein